LVPYSFYVKQNGSETNFLSLSLSLSQNLRRKTMGQHQQEIVADSALVRRILLALAIVALIATASAGPAAAGTVFQNHGELGQSGDVGTSSQKTAIKVAARP
jgi:hypothetical protein